jgi:hypothetical protein
MTTHVEHLRAALDAYDSVRFKAPAWSNRRVEASDELATRVRDLLEQIEGIRDEGSKP